MRQPLTRQNSTRVKRRYSAYQNRIFFYLVTLVTAPLLLLGVLSSVVYYRQTVTRSDALLASARENVETQMEIALSNLRAYYSAVISADNYQTLCKKTVPPYSEYTLVRDMQTAMRGGNLVDKYVEGYTYINLRSGWILSNNGMYRLADAANRDEVVHLLGEWAEPHAAMMWVNRTDQPTPARADTPLNTVDLTGELLVLRSSSYRTGNYAVLIVKLDLSPLYEMTESWQTGGYSIAARDFTGKTVLSTSAALTALLDANTPAEGGCVLGGWRLNSGKMGVNGLTYYAALPQRTLAATAGTVILIAFVLAGGLVAVLLICRRSTSVLYAPVDDLMHAATAQCASLPPPWRCASLTRPVSATPRLPPTARRCAPLPPRSAHRLSTLAPLPPPPTPPLALSAARPAICGWAQSRTTPTSKTPAPAARHRPLCSSFCRIPPRHWMCCG